MKGKSTASNETKIYSVYNNVIDSSKNEDVNSSFGLFISFQHLAENNNSLETVTIRIRDVQMSTGVCMMVEIQDLTNVLTKGISRV